MKKILILLLAIYAFGLQNMNAQDAPIRIITGHPDIKLKVTRCIASDKTVIVDMILTNVSEFDINNFRIEGSAYGTKVYDNLGNIYKNNIGVRIGNQQYNKWYNIGKLISEVPTQISIMIENVTMQAEYLALIEPRVSADGYTFANNTFKIRNIPITRE